MSASVITRSVLIHVLLLGTTVSAAGREIGEIKSLTIQDAIRQARALGRCSNDSAIEAAHLFLLACDYTDKASESLRNGNVYGELQTKAEDLVSQGGGSADDLSDASANRISCMAKSKALEREANRTTSELFSSIGLSSSPSLDCTSIEEELAYDLPRLISHAEHSNAEVLCLNERIMELKQQIRCLQNQLCQCLRRRLVGRRCNPIRCTIRARENELAQTQAALSETLDEIRATIAENYNQYLDLEAQAEEIGTVFPDATKKSIENALNKYSQASLNYSSAVQRISSHERAGEALQSINLEKRKAIYGLLVLSGYQ